MNTDTMTKMIDLQQQLYQITMTIDEMTSSMTIQEAYTTRLWADGIKNVMAVIVKTIDNHSASIVPRDTKQLVWDHDGHKYRTEVHFSASRTKILKDDLLRAVKQTARTLDETTGEISISSDDMIKLLETAYRFEPRWTEIKALGIDPDEFCTTKYEPKVSTSIIDSEQETQ